MKLDEAKLYEAVKDKTSINLMDEGAALGIPYKRLLYLADKWTKPSKDRDRVWQYGVSSLLGWWEFPQ